MAKLTLKTREIGAVNVFDLEGDPTDEAVQEIADKIQRKIRRHRMQRVILNLKNMPEIDPIAMRRLLASCIRPKRSVIFGASEETSRLLADSCMASNMRLCSNEEQVAEDLGPFLLEKESDKQIERENPDVSKESIGHQVERRRAKRMHVAMPVEFRIRQSSGDPIFTKAIITNISEGGMYAEYLDLDHAKQIEALNAVDGLKVEIRIPACANFPEEYQVNGVITRKELRKKQLGLAIKFIET